MDITRLTVFALPLAEEEKQFVERGKGYGFTVLKNENSGGRTLDTV